MDFLRKPALVLFYVTLCFVTLPNQAHAAEHIFVDQVSGINSSGTAGTEAYPFKSITYAMLTTASRGLPDPWVVHIKAGTYDANPVKPASEREIFPIELRNGITIQGDDGAEQCIVSGAFNPNSGAAILRGQNLSGLTIKAVTLKNMTRTGGTGNGGAVELINSSGTVQGCVFSTNSASKGGGIWLSEPAQIMFRLSGNTFSANSASQGGGAFYVSGSFTGDITGNTFSANSTVSQDGGGIHVSGSFVGNIAGNTFSGNSASYRGGGFYVIGSFKGNITDNTFSANSSGSTGAGFYVRESFTGTITGNAFSANSTTVAGGVGFCIYGLFTGHITDNTFTANSTATAESKGGGGGFYVDNLRGKIERNVFSRNSTGGGGGFSLGGAGGEPGGAIIVNNLFLYNAISRSDKLRGAGFWTNKNATVINNTFYGGAAGESCITIASTASGSVVKNNLFANLGTAIWLEGEIDPTISYNDFHNLTDIVNRNNQGLGNDAFFVDLILPGCSNNHDWAPGIVGEDAETGVLDQEPVYDPVNNYTIFTDSDKSWTGDRWRGAMLNLSSAPGSRRHYPVVGNTATQVMVRGNLEGAGLGLPGAGYSIDDYHLASGSENIDTGTMTTAAVDFENDLRPQGDLLDIGADEFFTGETPPYPTITPAAGPNGRILPLGTSAVNFGSDQTYTITPDSGYHVADVQVDGVSIGAVTAYTFNDVTTAGHTIHADFAITSTSQSSHVYVDQENGVNDPNLAGTEAYPFKSITYAVLTMASRELPDPWVVHIKAGTYDANPAKPANEREIFPIELRVGITIQGDDGAEQCIISGAFNPNSSAAILRGQNVSGLTIKNLTLKDMKRTGGTGNGGAVELINTSGTVHDCVFKNNSASRGGGIWLSQSAERVFLFSGNSFTGNSAASSGQYGGGIFVNGSFTGTIAENRFCGNAADERGGGFYVGGSFTGNIRNNTFSKNSAGSLCAGFGVGGTFMGNITRNVFSANSTVSSGGVGFWIYGSYTGDITENVFTGNSVSTSDRGSGGGFHVQAIFVGKIERNIFSWNSTKLGSGFCLASSGGDAGDAIVANNLFLYNVINGTNMLGGAALRTSQNVTLINNTFYGGATGQSCVNLMTQAFGSLVKNNLFANLGTAIWLEGEIDPTISYNDFHNLTDIVNRNNQGLGNDAFFIDLILPGCSNNHDWAPGIVGEDAETGVLDQEPVYDPANNYTIFTDLDRNWTVDQWRGALLNLSSTPGSRRHYPVVGNTATQVMVRGNLEGAGLGLPGADYSIDDYHLASGSNNIDAGTFTTAAVDFENELRPQGDLLDIGADEFFTGEVETYTVTAAAGAGGTIAPSGNIQVNFGLDQSFTITASQGFHVVNVVVDSVGVGAVTEYTFQDISGSHSIYATFSPNADNYLITATAGSGGSITPSGGVTVQQGSNQSFSITPTGGFEIDVVFVDGLYVGGTSLYTFQDVYSNHSIFAGFKYVGQVNPSTIGSLISDESIVLGGPLKVTGQISPNPTLAGAFVDVVLTPPAGPVIHRTVIANSQGEFSYELACGDINQSGTWIVNTSWNGDAGLIGTSSETTSLEVSKAESRVTLDVTSRAIKLGDPVSISGKFTPQPDCGEVPAGTSVTLSIIAPDSQPVEPSPVLLTNKYGQFLLQNYDGLNALGKWTLQASFAGNDAYLPDDSDPLNVRVVETAGYAILVQGKIASEEGMDSHIKTTTSVYDILKSRGLLDDDVKYFAYDPSLPGYDGTPSKSAVQTAITQWARDKMNTRPANLYIVMVNHGFDDVFRIDPDEITSSELAGWLGTLQSSLIGDATNQEIVVILGFCRSGSFIDDISAAYRVIITSAAPGESSYKGPLDEDNIRNGEYFISEFFKSVSFGKSIKTAFQEAVSLTEAFTAASNSSGVNAPYYDNSLQHPLLDDNGDGVGSHDLSDPDGDGKCRPPEEGVCCEELFIGVSSITGNAPGDVMVTKVANAVFLGEGENSTDGLWARVDDKSRVRTVWVEVKPPGYSPVDPGGTGQVAMELTKTPTITYSDLEERYEWIGVGGFSEPGTYQVFYFAKDDITGNISPLMETRVYKALAGNSPPEPFSLVLPGDGSELPYEVILLDWDDTRDPDGDRVTYTILISRGDTSFSDPIRKEGLEHSTCVVSRAEDGITELSRYYWKVQAIDKYGAMRETSVRDFSTNFVNLLPGWIKGYVYDQITKNPIANAVVNVGAGNLMTALEGYYLGVFSPGTYEITVSANGYEQKNSSGIPIPEGGMISKDFEMVASQRVEAPTFSPVPGTYTSAQRVQLFCTTEGATIRYTTDGSDPTESSTVYSSAIGVSSTMTIKARAYMTDWAPSEAAVGAYTITGTVATPSFSPAPGTYTTAQSVGLSCSTAGATIRYTTDGSDPTESSAVYSSAIGISSTMTIKARAYMTDWAPSEAAVGAYTITGTVATPSFSPAPGTYTTAQSVGLSCSTAGATIRYTTDGSDPTESSAVYSSAIGISSTKTIKARAYMSDWAPSEAAVGAYTINFLKGDISRDGNVDLADAILALKILCAVGASGTETQAGAEVNGDRKIGITEVIYIFQKVSELRE